MVTVLMCAMTDPVPSNQKSGSHGDQTSPEVITPVASGSLPNTLADPLPIQNDGVSPLLDAIAKADPRNYRRAAQPPSKDRVSEAADIVNSFIRYAYDQGMHEVGIDPVKILTDEIERQAAQIATLKGYIERTAYAGYRCAECAERLTAEPVAGYIEATNGLGISGVWCTKCGSKQEDGHLVGCPNSGASQPPRDGQ